MQLFYNIKQAWMQYLEAPQAAVSRNYVHISTVDMNSFWFIA